MVGVEVWIDGEKRFVAPITGMQLLIAGVYAGSRLSQEPRAGAGRAPGLGEPVPTSIGSEVRLAIVEVEAADEPIERSPRTESE